MEDNSVWPPRPKNQASYDYPAPKPYLFIWVPLSAVAFGFALGVLDVRRTDDLAVWLTIGIAAILGFLHTKTFLLSVFILSLCLYLVHVVAIQHGVKQPYVEPNVDSAMNCWQSLLGNGLGGLVGAAMKVFEQYGKVGPQKP